jgi:hypothetical protein
VPLSESLFPGVLPWTAFSHSSTSRASRSSLRVRLSRNKFIPVLTMHSFQESPPPEPYQPPQISIPGPTPIVMDPTRRPSMPGDVNMTGMPSYRPAVPMPPTASPSAQYINQPHFAPRPSTCSPCQSRNRSRLHPTSNTNSTSSRRSRLCSRSRLAMLIPRPRVI